MKWSELYFTNWLISWLLIVMVDDVWPPMARSGVLLAVIWGFPRKGGPISFPSSPG